MNDHRVLTAFVVVATLACATVLCGAGVAGGGRTVYVDPANNGREGADGSKTRPLKSVAKALTRCTGGETIVLADGQYPAVSIGDRFPKVVTIRAANKLRSVMVGGVTISGASNVHLSGLRFTWTPKTRAASRKKAFIRIDRSKQIIISGCEISDDPKAAVYHGFSVTVSNSDQITIRDGNIHHVYFGVSFYRSTNCTASGLTIGPWSHEDGIRVTECTGPTLIDNCRISNAGNQGRRTGHVDAIQVVHWSDNLTIRNCVIHNVSQAIGAFSSTKRRRKNWRIEGNLIYDVYTPHYCTVNDTDGIVVVNNTLPQGVVRLGGSTGAVVKNNIFGGGALPTKSIKEADHNLWIHASRGSRSRKQKFGPHDMVGQDAKFVNAPKFFGKCDYWGKGRKEQFTDRKLWADSSLAGKIAVGDHVELLIADGRPRDGVLRKVVRVNGRQFEVDKPTDVSMKGKMVLIYNWGSKPTSTKPDYHLQPLSRAIDSADGSVQRGKDMDGRKPHDHATTKNTGTGKIKHLDRGALEYAPRGK